jgi:hypothetical protein
MPRAGFEPTIPMLERPKTVLALDRHGRCLRGSNDSVGISLANHRNKNLGRVPILIHEHI